MWVTKSRVGRMWIGLTLSLLTVISAQGAERRLNVVMLLVDDMGWTGPSGFGSDLHETPNIDRLMHEGMKFTNAYAAAAICSPTRASIMTGRSPATLHMTIWREYSKNQFLDRKLLPPDCVGDLPHDETTLAEAFQSAGYRTAHVGKWHLGDGAHYPQNHGFDINVGGTMWGCPVTFYYPYKGLFGREKEPRYVPDLGWGRPGDYLTDRLTDEAIRIIDEAGDQPFFLNMWYYTVHTPIEGKPEIAAHYERKIRDGMEHRNAHFAAMHQSLDESVGRILARLEQRGLADHTLVLFGSDNGGFVNEHRGVRVTSNRPLRSGKGSLYEGGIRVPLIVRWPGVVSAGTVCDRPVVTTDFYPTLLEAAGVKGDPKHNARVEGKSLVGLLRDPKEKLDRDALFFHYPHYYVTTTPVSAVRAGEWKLLEYFEDGHLELYDLENDLGENENLASAKPDVTEKLRTRLRDWRQRVNAQMPRPNPNFRPKTPTESPE